MRRSVFTPSVAAGLLLGLVASAFPQNPFGAPTIVGRIVWPDHDLTNGQVRVFKDEALKEHHDSFASGGPGGTFVAIVDPGTYFLMAVVDVNTNQKLDEGDGIGFFGMASLDEGQARKAITVPAEGLVRDVQIPIIATLDAEGEPVPVEAPAEVEVTPGGIPAAAAGLLTERDDVTAPAFVLALDTDTHAPSAIARVPRQVPGFEFALPAGEYQLLALADVSGDGKLGPGDRVGAYGVADWALAPELLPSLALGDGDEIGGLSIALSGHLNDEGVVCPAEAEGTFALDLATLPPILSGTVRFPGAGLKPTQIRVSADPGMRNAIALLTVEPGPGTFVATLAPGTYYLTAIVDEDGNGAFGPGDAIGFHGVADLTGGAPEPITLSPASLAADADITIVARITQDGRLAPVTAGAPDAEGNPQQ